jgi:hypothetical protein
MIFLAACIFASAGGSLNENHFFILLGFLKSSKKYTDGAWIHGLRLNPFDAGKPHLEKSLEHKFNAKEQQLQ